MLYAADHFIARLTAIIGAGRMPLPPLCETNALGYHPVPNLAGAPKKLVVKGDVGASPSRVLFDSCAVLIALGKILDYINLALNIFDIPYARDGTTYV